MVIDIFTFTRKIAVLHHNRIILVIFRPILGSLSLGQGYGNLRDKMELVSVLFIQRHLDEIYVFTHIVPFVFIKIGKR